MKFKKTLENNWQVFLALLLPLLHSCSSQKLTQVPVAADHQSVAINSFTEITKKLSNATVLIAMCNLAEIDRREFSNVQARGTGFFINGTGLLLTARHAISLPLKEGDAIFALRIEGQSAYWATSTRVVYDWPDLDVVAIKFDDASVSKFGSLPLSDETPSAGQEVGVFGYPAAKFSMKSNNQFDRSNVVPRVVKTAVSNIDVRTIETNTAVLQDKLIIETQNSLAAGNSGSPLVSVQDGRVLGVVIGGNSIAHSVVPVKLPNTKPFLAPVFTTFGSAVSIREITQRLQSSDFRNQW